MLIPKYSFVLIEQCGTSLTPLDVGRRYSKGAVSHFWVYSGHWSLDGGWMIFYIYKRPSTGFGRMIRQDVWFFLWLCTLGSCKKEQSLDIFESLLISSLLVLRRMSVS